MSNLIVDHVVTSTISEYEINNLNIQKGELYEITASINGGTQTGWYYLTFNDNNTISNYWSSVPQFNGSLNQSGVLNQPGFGYQFNNSSNYMKGYIRLTNDGYILAYTKTVMGLNGSTVWQNCFIASTFTANEITKIRFGGQKSGMYLSDTRFQLRKIEEQISDIETGSSVSEIVFDNLNIQKGEKYLLVSDLFSSAGGRIFFNDNTTDSNYWDQLFKGDNSTAQARANVASLAWGSGNSYTISEIYISESGNILAKTEGFQDIPGSNIIMYLSDVTSTFTQNSISKIHVTTSLGIDTNSKFTLYKLD